MKIAAFDSAFSHLMEQPQWLVGAAGLGFAGGVGLRSGKNLRDLWKDQDSATAVEKNIPSMTANRAQIPVTVTPEEAQELAARGVKVAMSPTFLDNFALGATAVGGAALGWHAVDGMYDNQRLSSQQQKLDQIKKRVHGLLAGSPQPQDATLGTAMKTAEERLLKEGSVAESLMHGLAGFANGLPSWLPASAGGGATLVAASAFNEARKRNKALNNSKAISQYAATLPTRAPIADLEPVLAKTAASAANTLTDDNFDAQTAVAPASAANTLTDDNFDAQTTGLPAAPVVRKRPDVQPANWQPNSMGQEQVVDSSANSTYGRPQPTQGTWSAQPPAPAPFRGTATLMDTNGKPVPGQTSAAVPPVAPTYTGSKPLIFPVGKTAALKAALGAAHARVS